MDVVRYIHIYTVGVLRVTMAQLNTRYDHSLGYPEQCHNHSQTQLFIFSNWAKMIVGYGPRIIFLIGILILFVTIEAHKKFGTLAALFLVEK